jgi:hypothetical protein
VKSVPVIELREVVGWSWCPVFGVTTIQSHPRGECGARHEVLLVVVEP